MAEILHLSTFLRRPIFDQDGDRIGRVQDLVARLGDGGNPPLFIRCDLMNIAALELAIEEARKRLDELEIRRGENVMLGHTGKRLGTVRDVVLDGGELAGVVVHPVGFFKEDVLLQIRFLGRSDDLALFAHLSEADIARLTPFHPSRTP